MKKKYLFGPVPSRRLGTSLGIDLVPPKTCSLNCVYCECGRTTDLTIARKEYVPLGGVLEELDNFLQNKPELDYITFAGSGEPTLHIHIDQVIDYIKLRFPQYPVCLLTNGTLFSSREVREQVLHADLIIPSLDAATNDTFRRLNRPHPILKCEKIIDGLAALRREYRGKMPLEIFIVPGLNDTERELAAIKIAVEKIEPDQVLLGTLDRPGAEPWVKETAPDKMQEISAYLGDKAGLIEKPRSRTKTPHFDEDYRETILQTIRRRPCTAHDLSLIMGVHPAEVQKYLRHLLAAELIEMKSGERGTFVKIKKPPK